MGPTVGNESLIEQIKDLESKGEAHQLGYITSEELVYLYSKATVFAFLSHYEGFGIPVIEAMGLGAPVLIGQDPAVTEAAGDAALSVDAEKPELICDALQRLLGDSKLRTDLSELGKQNVKRFSWKRVPKSWSQSSRHWTQNESNRTWPRLNAVKAELHTKPACVMNSRKMGKFIMSWYACTHRFSPSAIS